MTSENKNKWSIIINNLYGLTPEEIAIVEGTSLNFH